LPAPPPQSIADVRQTGECEHQTLGLGGVLRELERKRRPRVLDLGPALGASVEFLARYSVQLFIADLYRSVRSSTGQLPPDASRLRRLLEEQLPVPEDGPFDLVLAWDLLNYFATDQLEALGQHLGALCRPGGQMFALVATRGPISDRPRTFEIIAHDALRYGANAAAERPIPGYRETALERLLDAFAVQTSYLLRNGMQEYIFTRRMSHSTLTPQMVGR
jgi:SAM-dependent methyltransferase